MVQVGARLPRSPSDSHPLTSRLIVIISIARILLFATFMTVAACIPVLVRDWEVSAAGAGSIVSAMFVSYAVSLFALSWTADHVGAKRTVLVSSLAAAASSAVFGLWARDYWSALVLYALVGLCQGGVYTPLVMLFSENARADRRGTAMGWLIGSTSIGYAGSLALSGAGIAIGGWQAAFLLTGSLPVVGAVLLIWSLRNVPNRIHPRHDDSGLVRQLGHNRDARLLVGGYVAHNWELLGLWSWTPTLVAASFAMAGATTSIASQSSAYVAAAMHVIGAFAALLVGGLSDRLGRRTVLLGMAAIAAALSLSIGWLVALPPWIISCFALIYYFFALGDSPVLTTALAERVDPASLGAILAVRSLLGFGAGAVAPIAVGGIIDVLRTGGHGETLVWGAGFVVLGCGGLLATLLAYRLAR